MKREYLALAGVVAVFVAGGTALMQSGLLPEERAKDFRSLESISLQSEIQVIQEPTAADNTYIYAINEVARQSWDIASADPAVKDILAGIGGTAVTIAAVQPTAFVSPDGKVTHSGQGQVIITANWQLVDGRRYSGTSFVSLDGRAGESHQRIWNVQVDLDRQKVISIVAEQERVMRETLATNVVYGGMNMYLPEVVEAKAGSTVSCRARPEGASYSPEDKGSAEDGEGDEDVRQHHDVSHDVEDEGVEHSGRGQEVRLGDVNTYGG